MKAWSLLLTRVTIGYLLVMWGLDKLVNVDHSVRVAEAFYFGIGAQVLILNIFGVLETILGLMIIVGVMRRLTYPIMILLLGITAIGVWKSILDPWSWVLEGSNVLFYPSAIILAAALVLRAFMDEDELCLDARKRVG